MKEKLYDLYWNQNKSQRAIARELGWNQDKVKKEMRRLGIPARTLSQSQKINDLNPWKNKTEEHKKNISKSMRGNKNMLGHSHSEETILKISLAQRKSGIGWHEREYRKMAFANLKQVCVKCKRTHGLCVHHKDGDHFNNELTNLEMRCRSCHMKWHRKHQPEKYLKS